MIRINLLGVERQKAKKAVPFDVGQRLTLACSLILVATALALGWWYWSLNEESSRLDTEIAAAQTRQVQLANLLTEVRQFEARRTQLQQRVGLIEQLRAGQSLPVQVLDHVSRSVTDSLWLTSMDQAVDGITIEGRSTTLPALTAFVTNLGNSPLFQKPIEIPDAKQETITLSAPATGSIDVIRFTVRAPLAKRPAPAAGPGAPGAAAATPAAPAGAR